jgi:hypothetical protein
MQMKLVAEAEANPVRRCINCEAKRTTHGSPVLSVDEREQLTELATRALGRALLKPVGCPPTRDEEKLVEAFVASVSDAFGEILATRIDDAEADRDEPDNLHAYIVARVKAMKERHGSYAATLLGITDGQVARIVAGLTTYR